MNLPKPLTSVTSFSKILAAVLFITLPFVGFYLGIEYESQFTKYLEDRSSLDRYSLKPSPKTQNVSTANWKTYINNDLSFSVKYPPSLFLDEIKGESPRIRLTKEDLKKFQGGDIFLIGIGIYDNPSKLSPKDWWENEIKRNPANVYREYIKFTQRGEKIIDRHKAYFVTPSQGWQGLSENNIYVGKENKIYGIGVSNYDDADYKLFNQILSTFKFTDQEEAIPPQVCTQDAKLCPDGKTYVSRQPPNCEFAACP